MQVAFVWSELRVATCRRDFRLQSKTTTTTTKMVEASRQRQSSSFSCRAGASLEGPAKSCSSSSSSEPKTAASGREISPTSHLPSTSTMGPEAKRSRAQPAVFAPAFIERLVAGPRRAWPATLAAAALVIVLCLSSATPQVTCSPPIDFLVHTSQLATAKNNGLHKITSDLHSLESIYFSLANELAANTTTQPSSINQQKPQTDDQSAQRNASASTTNSGGSENRQANMRYLAGKVLELVKDATHRHDDDRAADFELTRYAWHLMERQALSYAQDRVLTIKPLISELLVESQASSQCQESLLGWLDRFAALDDWALIMWNAWGDFPAAGLFEGSFTDLGSYQGCLSVRDNPLIGQAQYCTLDFEPIIPTRTRFHSVFKRILAVDPSTRQLTGADFDSLRRRQLTSNDPKELRRSNIPSHAYTASRFFKTHKESSSSSPLSAANALRFNSSAVEALAKVAHYFYYVKLRVGSCWPTKCSRHDIQNIVQSAGAFAVLRASEPFCTKRNETKLADRMNNYQLLAVFILAGLAAITLAATCLDIAQDLLFFFSFRRQSKWISNRFNLYIDTYSLCRNSARLFTVSVNKVDISSTTTTMTEGKRQELPAQMLTCLHGLKFISMLWVIYGHTLLFSDYQSYSHPMKTIEGNIANIWTLPSLIPNFSVDTFFVISGLLSAYIIFSLDVKFNGILYTIARYIRLTPQLIIVILLFFLLPLMGEGPIYKQGTETQASNCMKNWWLNLLYLQSYVNRRELCMIPSWWLSIEMTFHLISLFVIYLLIKNPRIGMVANWAVICVMTLIGSVYHYANGFAIQYLPSIPQKYEIEYEQTQHFFHMPYPHAPSFFLGIALGYALAKRTIKRIQTYQLYLGWISCTAIFAICLFGSYNWNLGAPYTQLEATIYYNACQVLWPLSVSWVILTCSLGQGGIVNSILSADFFIPFGRITYMTYLSHMVVVYYYAASIQQTFEPNFLNMVSVMKK